MLTYSSQNLTNQRRTPCILATINNDALIVAQAVAMKVKNHIEFGDNITIVSEYTGESSWEYIRLLIKKLQSEVRTEFPSTKIICIIDEIDKFSSEMVSFGAIKIRDGVYDISRLSPLL